MREKLCRSGKGEFLGCGWKLKPQEAWGRGSGGKQGAPAWASLPKRKSQGKDSVVRVALPLAGKEISDMVGILLRGREWDEGQPSKGKLSQVPGCLGG